MKSLYIIACLFAALFLSACGASDTPAYDTSLTPANETKPVTPVTIADTLFSDTTRSSAALSATPTLVTGPQTISNSAKPAIVSQSQPAVVKSGAGLNPAHGQPGHRCEIAVGAPLNSAPAAATTAQPVIQSTTPAIQQPQSVSVPAVNAASPVISSGSGKVNPAHGQPGHDCAVPVGSPLKN